jgi:hypothetical protein
MTTATEPAAGDAKANWPKLSAWYASAVTAVVLAPAATILAVWHVIEHPGPLGRWLAEYTAGFGLLCIAAGVGMKYTSRRDDRRTDAAYAAARAAGADEQEIFDILHYGPPAQASSKLRTTASTIALLAPIAAACWGLQHLAS